MRRQRRYHLGYPPLPALPQPVLVQRPACPLVGTQPVGGLVQVAEHVQQIHDRLEVREVALLNRPVIGQPIGHEGPAARRIEVACLRLARHHRPERPAVRHARHAGPRPAFGGPRLVLDVTACGWLDPHAAVRPRPGGRGAVATRLAGLARHLLDQPLHPPWLEEAGRRLGLRVLIVRGAAQRRQAGDLVLLVLGLVDAAARPGRPRPQPAAIDLDDHRRRRLVHPRLQLTGAALLGLGIALPCQLGAHLVGQLLHVAGRDGQAR